MKVELIKFLPLGFAALLMAACAAPIYQVQDAPVLANVASPSMDDVTKAIVRAGTGLGWQMKVESPGNILGTLKLRTHVAIVDVKYDRKTFNITYRDSTNLNYTGTTIHKNYNGWIQNLENAIKAQLTNL